MKKISFLVILTLFLALVVTGATGSEVYSQAGAPRARITLSPPFGSLFRF